jgi:hypothetical protein
MALFALISVYVLFTLTGAAGIAVCPGEGDRYEDFKCNHDFTHRVCAKLLDKSGSPLNWGAGNFWQITGQEDFQWDDQIRANGGDSWCICMWATARLIEAAGCDAVHIDCAATDVAYVESKYTDGGVDLAPANKCLQQKCGSGLQQASDATLPAIEAKRSIIGSGTIALTAMAALASVGTAFGVQRFFARQRPSPAADQAFPAEFAE